MLHYVTHLSCYCDQTSDTKQMKEETVYLGSQFEGPGHHGGDVMEPWSWGGCPHHSHTQKAEWWVLLFPSFLSNFCRFCRVPWVLWGSVFSWTPLNCRKPWRKHPKWASNSYCHLQSFCFLQSPIRSDALGLSAPMDLPTSYQHLLWECTWVGTDLNASFLRTSF